MINIYSNASCASSLRSIVGELITNTTTAGEKTIVCDGTPIHVRRYNDTYNWGLLMTETTDYTITGSTISLVTAPSIGDTTLVISSGEYLFEKLSAAGNSTTAGDRTMEQKLYLRSEGANASNITVSIYNVFDSSTIDEEDHYLALNDGGVPGAYGAAGAELSVGNIASGATAAIWVKCIVPYDTEMENFHNIYLGYESSNFSTHL
jgi:hypothetical protein